MDLTEFKFARLASVAEIEDRKRETLASLRCEEPKQSNSTSGLSRELLSYLNIIRDNPGMQATKRDQLVGISLRKGSRLRKQLQELGLIEEIQANPGRRGQAFVDVRLTPKGEALLG
ncbi:hypothetical protein MYX77_08130 [Acidobacteriia bacterium AH_259_A11_L15]|nr:hypothetical protein [Acidobacteriia bacterium AH_259_A11_L15]